MPRTSPPRKDKNKVPREKRALPPAPAKAAERVAKVIARAGLASRREIEEWILAGRVAVNGTVLESPAVTVTASDTITVDGAPLPERERTRLYLYHKPSGVVTTNKDPEGRATLFEILPKGLPRLVSVGRLDLNSEGLLLLTNDGGLARVLELPETGWLRRYRVRANGTIDQAKLDTLMRGISVGGVDYGPIEAVLDRVQGANAWITVALREGKNREVRNVLGALGLKVNRLIRISYGPFQLGEIEEGGIEEVRTRVLRDQIGDDLARAAGADFTGPLVDYEIEEEEPPARRLAAARRSAAKAAAEKAEPPRARRGAPAQDDFAGPSPEHRPRRRLKEEHEVESRGTVADRKGRTVTVERVVASRTTDAPAGRGKSAVPRGGKSGPRADGRESLRGAGTGQSSFRGRRNADFEGAEARPRGGRFGSASGEARGGRTGASSRDFDETRRGRASRPAEGSRTRRFEDADAPRSRTERTGARSPREQDQRDQETRAPRARTGSSRAEAPGGRPARPSSRMTSGADETRSYSDRPPRGRSRAGDDGDSARRFGEGGGHRGAPGGRFGRDTGAAREAGDTPRPGKPGGFKGRGSRDHGMAGSAEKSGPRRGRFSGLGEDARPPRAGGKPGAGRSGAGKPGAGKPGAGKSGPRGGAPGGKRPSGPRSSGPRPGGPRGKR